MLKTIKHWQKRKPERSRNELDDTRCPLIRETVLTFLWSQANLEHKTKTEAPHTLISKCNYDTTTLEKKKKTDNNRNCPRSRWFTNTINGNSTSQKWQEPGRTKRQKEKKESIQIQNVFNIYQMSKCVLALELQLRWQLSLFRMCIFYRTNVVSVTVVYAEHKVLWVGSGF